MNNPSKTHKAKGISVEGFWRQLNAKTAQTDTEANTINSGDMSEANIELHGALSPKENWESRFDEWLDRL